MMNKIDKKKLLIIGGGLILLIIIIVLLIFVFNKNEEENKVMLKLDNIVSDKYCELKLDDTEDYHIYYILNIDLDNERVLSTQTTVRMEYFNEESYQTNKENGDFPGNYVYDDKTKTILYEIDDKTDFTKDEKGEELILNYDEYKTSLEEASYVCY